MPESDNQSGSISTSCNGAGFFFFFFFLMYVGLLVLWIKFLLCLPFLCFGLRVIMADRDSTIYEVMIRLLLKKKNYDGERNVCTKMKLLYFIHPQVVSKYVSFSLPKI